MNEVNLDLAYLSKLTTILLRTGFCGASNCCVAGGAIRDMLLNKPVSDIDVFYEGTVNTKTLQAYFEQVQETDIPNYPEGFNVTHKLKQVGIPVPIQLIQVNNIEEHIKTFPSPMMRMWFDMEGLHGLSPGVIADANSNVFFWDQKVDLPYFLKIKNKYSDWKHMFHEDEHNPEFEPELEF
jgi:Poly A polymerase head domain